MTAIQISFLGCAVPSFMIGYEMLGVSGLSKYDTIALKVRIVGMQETGQVCELYKII
jgi:hypothetical protein